MLDDSIISRYYERVRKHADPDACWGWGGATDKDGYGRVVYRRKNYRAHRVSYLIHVGTIPEGLGVLHRCDNPPCTNPAHLFLGTNIDNLADMRAKGRGARGDRNGARLHPERVPRGDDHYSRRQPELAAHGEQHGNAKLTRTHVIEMRALRRQGMTLDELAAIFPTTRANIHLIVTGKAWKHIADE